MFLICVQMEPLVSDVMHYVAGEMEARSCKGKNGANQIKGDAKNDDDQLTAEERAVLEKMDTRKLMNEMKRRFGRERAACAEKDDSSRCDAELEGELRDVICTADSCVLVH